MIEEEKKDVRDAKPIIIGVAALILRAAYAAGSPGLMSPEITALNGAKKLYEKWEEEFLA